MTAPAPPTLPEVCRCGGDMVMSGGITPDRRLALSTYCPHCDRPCPIRPPEACVRCSIQSAKDPE